MEAAGSRGREENRIQPRWGEGPSQESGNASTAGQQELEQVSLMTCIIRTIVRVPH